MYASIVLDTSSGAAGATLSETVPLAAEVFEGTITDLYIKN